MLACSLREKVRIRSAHEIGEYVQREAIEQRARRAARLLAALRASPAPVLTRVLLSGDGSEDGGGGGESEDGGGGGDGSEDGGRSGARVSIIGGGGGGELGGVDAALRQVSAPSEQARQGKACDRASVALDLAALADLRRLGLVRVVGGAAADDAEVELEAEAEADEALGWMLEAHPEGDERLREHWQGLLVLP